MDGDSVNGGPDLIVGEHRTLIDFSYRLERDDTFTLISLSLSEIYDDSSMLVRLDE